MTSNQVNNRNYVETKRHNKRSEQIEAKKAKAAQDTATAKKISAAVGAVDTAVKTASVFNDVKWYGLSEQLLEDVSRISFNTALGLPVNPGLPEPTVFPGIMELDFVPLFGAGLNSADALNTAAKQIYSYVRHANSGARNYEAIDLMEYIMVVDSAYMLWSHLRRAYGILMVTDGRNRYLNYAMVRAMGFNPQSLMGELASLRALINRFGVLLNALYIPKVLPVLERHSWMCSNVFKDNPVFKSQFYIFKPTHYYSFDDVVGAAKLTAINYGTNGMTYTTISNLINAVMNNLTSSEDIGIMSGDVLKAYGEGQLWYVPAIPEGFTVEPAYNEEVLSQIENITITGELISKTGNSLGYFQYTDAKADGILRFGSYKVSGASVTAGDLGIIVGPMASQPTSVTAELYNNALVNIYKDDVSAGDTMVATRLTCAGLTAYTGGVNGLKINDCGTEVVTKFYIWTINPSGAIYTSSVIPSEYITSTDDNVSMVGDISKFDYHPPIFLVRGDGDTKPYSYVYFKDVQNYGQVAPQVLANMHDVAILSELGVPLLGYTVRSK